MFRIAWCTVKLHSSRKNQARCIPFCRANLIHRDGGRSPGSPHCGRRRTLAHIDPDNPRDPYDGSRAHEDLGDETLVDMLNALAYHYFIHIVTGRGLRHCQVTEEWLYNHCVPYDHLWTRPDNDTACLDCMGEIPDCEGNRKNP